MLAAVSAGVGALAAFSPRSCAFCFGEGSRFFLEASPWKSVWSGLQEAKTFSEVTNEKKSLLR